MSQSTTISLDSNRTLAVRPDAMSEAYQEKYEHVVKFQGEYEKYEYVVNFQGEYKHPPTILYEDYWADTYYDKAYEELVTNSKSGANTMATLRSTTSTPSIEASATEIVTMSSGITTTRIEESSTSSSSSAVRRLVGQW